FFSVSLSPSLSLFPSLSFSQFLSCFIPPLSPPLSLSLPLFLSLSHTHPLSQHNICMYQYCILFCSRHKSQLSGTYGHVKVDVSFFFFLFFVYSIIWPGLKNRAILQWKDVHC
ncbi:hypothetical protein ANANG_G00140100, partial [Anguilla anguilla]